MILWWSNSFRSHFVFNETWLPARTSNWTLNWCKTHICGCFWLFSLTLIKADTNPLDFIWSILLRDVSRIRFETTYKVVVQFEWTGGDEVQKSLSAMVKTAGNFELCIFIYVCVKKCQYIQRSTSKISLTKTSDFYY